MSNPLNYVEAWAGLERYVVLNLKKKIPSFILPYVSINMWHVQIPTNHKFNNFNKFMKFV